MRARRRAGQAGITMIEMLIVLTIIAVMTAVTYPSIASGIETIRLRSAADSVASFLTQAITRVERSQEPVELTIAMATGRLESRSVTMGRGGEYVLPDGVSVFHVYPEPPGDAPAVRSFVLMPGAPFPGVSIELMNRRGQRRLVRIDPLASVPMVEIPKERVEGEVR